MGYVPGFNNDIFISYSHIDDQAVDGPGWVTDFHRRLAIEVEEELGAKVQIWRDKRITGATDFTKDLDKQVRGSAMLLAILSPGYVNSRWCDWELTGFAGSRRVGDLWVDTKCRAIKIFKRPVDVSGLRVLAETEGMKFFDVDPANDVSYEMETSAALFKQRLTELGHDIGDVLRAMRKARTVFLGAASPSLRDQRERVREELKGRNYRVITAPDVPLDDLQRGVRGAVRESTLSVLFYDRSAPAGHSAEHLAALERSVAMDQQARQVIVVRGQPDPSSQPWDEPEAAGRGSAKVEWLIEPQVHTLYHTVLQMLEAQPATTSPEPEPPPPNASPPQPDLLAGLALPPVDGTGSREFVRLYLVCADSDHPLNKDNRARQLRDYLHGLGFEVKLPLADQKDADYARDNRDNKEYRKDNKNKLMQCDGVLLYWGTGGQAWFDGRLDELMQARGWRKGREFIALGAYVAEPKSPVKQNYETREVDELIKQFDILDLSDTRFVRFVARLAQTT
jgi:hypothetical protein